MRDIDSEPPLITEPQLLDVLEELRAREPIFHRPELGTKRADFEAQMADGFWEIGASGRRYGRDFVLATLDERWSQASPSEDRWVASGFHCRELAANVFALHYTLRQDARV